MEVSSSFGSRECQERCKRRWPHDSTEARHTWLHMQVLYALADNRRWGDDKKNARTGAPSLGAPSKKAQSKQKW